MPDFRVADTAPEHPKLRAAGLAAAGLWALAGAYSMRELTDGWVPDYWVQTWPSGRKHAARLVEVDLWSRDARRGIAGYRFHDWLSIQRSAAQIEEEKAAARERAKRSRSKSAARADERAPHVARESHDSLSLSLSPSGSVGGEASGTERDATRNEPPAPNLDPDNPRCRQHAHIPASDPGPNCRACRDVRIQLEAEGTIDPRDAARAAFRAAVDACDMCDERGMLELPDGRPKRCDHDQPTAVAS